MFGRWSLPNIMHGFAPLPQQVQTQQPQQGNPLGQYSLPGVMGRLFNRLTHGNPANTPGGAPSGATPWSGYGNPGSMGNFGNNFSSFGPQFGSLNG
jgi:hypothetical protein